MKYSQKIRFFREITGKRMNWHYFTVFVRTPLGFFLGIITLFQEIEAYKIISDSRVMPDLEPLFMIGIVMMALYLLVMAFGFVIHFSLNQKAYIALLIVLWGIVTVNLYQFISISVVSARFAYLDINISSTIGSIIGNLVFSIVTTIYYRRRKELFMPSENLIALTEETQEHETPVESNSLKNGL